MEADKFLYLLTRALALCEDVIISLQRGTITSNQFSSISTDLTLIFMISKSLFISGEIDDMINIQSFENHIVCAENKLTKFFQNKELEVASVN